MTVVAQRAHGRGVAEFYIPWGNLVGVGDGLAIVFYRTNRQGIYTQVLTDFHTGDGDCQ
jgi:hypothetical protein